MKLSIFLSLLFLSMNVWANVQTISAESIRFILTPYVLGDYELKANELQKYEKMNVEYTINTYENDMLWSYYVHPEVIIKFDDIVEMKAMTSEMSGNMMIYMRLSSKAGQKLSKITRENIGETLAIINPKTQEWINIANISAELNSDVYLDGNIHPELLKQQPDMEFRLMSMLPKQGYKKMMLKSIKATVNIPIYLQKQYKITEQHIDKLHIIHDKQLQEYHIVLELKNSAKAKAFYLERSMGTSWAIIGTVNQPKYLDYSWIRPEIYYRNTSLPESLKNSKKFILLRKFTNEYFFTEFLDNIQLK